MHSYLYLGRPGLIVGHPSVLGHPASLTCTDIVSVKICLSILASWKACSHSVSAPFSSQRAIILSLVPKFLQGCITGSQVLRVIINHLRDY